MSIAIQFFVYKHSQKWRPKCVVKIVFIDNLGFKGLLVNSGSKHAFKYGKKTLTEFSMAVDSKKNSLNHRI